jgi:hypothetical protein
MGATYIHDVPIPIAKAQFYLGYELTHNPKFVDAFQRCHTAAQGRELSDLLASLDAEWQSGKPNLDRASQLCGDLSRLLELPMRLIIFEQHVQYKIRR